jgi:hypothetical protein
MNIRAPLAAAASVRRPPGPHSGAGSATGRRRPRWCRRAATSFISGLTFVADRDLREARSRPELGGALVRGIAIAVHEDDRRKLAEPSAKARRDRGARRHRAARSRAVGATRSSDLDHALVEQLGQHDVRSNNPRPGLVADAQRVAKAARDDQQVRSPLRSSSALVATVVPIFTRVGAEQEAYSLLRRIQASPTGICFLSETPFALAENFGASAGRAAGRCLGLHRLEA